jgi:ElaB/YqjD/DUF883 family membrane-anchored ribosome-binding protein
MAIDAVRNASDKVSNVFNKAADIGESALENGYETAREYTDSGLDYLGDISERASEFVKRDPWIAVAGAFVVGYIAANLLRRMK